MRLRRLHRNILGRKGRLTCSKSLSVSESIMLDTPVALCDRSLCPRSGKGGGPSFFGASRVERFLFPREVLE